MVSSCFSEPFILLFSVVVGYFLRTCYLNEKNHKELKAEFAEYKAKMEKRWSSREAKTTETDKSMKEEFFGESGKKIGLFPKAGKFIDALTAFRDNVENEKRGENLCDVGKRLKNSLTDVQISDERLVTLAKAVSFIRMVQEYNFLVQSRKVGNQSATTVDLNQKRKKDYDQMVKSVRMIAYGYYKYTPICEVDKMVEEFFGNQYRHI